MFVRSRTRIRHDKQVLGWMAKCWTVALALAPGARSLSREAFDEYYRKPLSAMTVNWQDEAFTNVADMMWRRDAGSFLDVDYDRFCCSFDRSQWVNAVDVAEYVRILKLIHAASLDKIDEPIIHQFTPTSLNDFVLELKNQTALYQQNLSFGRSVFFDAERFKQSFDATVTALTSIQSSCKPGRRRSSEPAQSSLRVRVGSTPPHNRFAPRLRSALTFIK